MAKGYFRISDGINAISLLGINQERTVEEATQN